MQTQIATRAAAPPAGIVLADSRGTVRDHLAQTIRDQRDMRVLGSYETIQETWQSIRRSRPQILLLDWRLPDAGAMTLLRRLSPGPDLNVIVLTEERRPEVLARAMILGARGAISRAARPQTVLRCARAVLNGELWFPRAVTRALRDHILSSAAGTQDVPSVDDRLTPREADVVREIAQGLRNAEIACELGISVLTVRHHLKAVFAKLNVSSRLELALLAAKDRL